MKNNLIPFLIIGALFLITPIAFSLEDFEVGAMGGEKRLCPTHTETITIPIENKGDEEISFTVSLSGSAKNWAVAAPTGFTLKPGKVKSVYVWVTASSKALPGIYDLIINIDGGSAGEKELKYDIVIETCHDVKLTIEDSSKTACPGELTTYKVTVENTGEYTENFILSLSGAAKEWAVLSKDTLKLEKDEKREVNLHVDPTEGLTGTYNLLVTVNSKDSDAKDSESVELILESCYDYNIDSPKDVYNFCDHTHAKIPILIKNKGIVDNTYDLAVVGPDWATLENNEVSIAKNSEEVINLTVFPDYYEIGDYKIKIIAESKTGDISQEKEITVTVEPCFITELTLSTDEDSICAQSSKTYEVSLTNLGKFEEPYSISIEGPEWARLDKNFVELDEGESEVIDLIVDAPDTTGIHDIKIVAKSQEPSETSDEAILSLDIVSKEICFAISLTAELKEVDIAIGEGALIPIKLENRGKESATYSLEISGAGTSFAQLNPSTLAIESGKTEVAYLYIAIPEEVERDKYTLSVSARLEGGTVQASETIDVNVVPVGEGVDVEDIGEPGEPEEQEPTETEEEPEEPKEGIISSITSSIGGAASSVGNRITGAFSGVSGFSTVRDNWKYIVGAIIVILILVLLWQGTKEKSEESKIEKKEEPKEEKPKKRIREEEPEEEKPKKKKKKIVNKIRELLEEEED